MGLVQCGAVGKVVVKATAPKVGVARPDVRPYADKPNRSARFLRLSSSSADNAGFDGAAKRSARFRFLDSSSGADVCTALLPCQTRAPKQTKHKDRCTGAQAETEKAARTRKNKHTGALTQT